MNQVLRTKKWFILHRRYLLNDYLHFLLQEAENELLLPWLLWNSFCKKKAAKVLGQGRGSKRFNFSWTVAVIPQ